MGEAAFKLDTFEQRRAERVPLSADIDVFGDDNFWAGLTVNMSEGGVFVATYNLLPIGERVTVSISLRFETEPLVVDAVVRWTRRYAETSDAPPGLGLQFVDIDERTVERIREFVATVREPLLYDDE